MHRTRIPVPKLLLICCLLAMSSHGADVLPSGTSSWNDVVLTDLPQSPAPGGPRVTYSLQCFGTNLRKVDNPIAPYSHLAITFEWGSEESPISHTANVEGVEEGELGPPQTDPDFAETETNEEGKPVLHRHIQFLSLEELAKDTEIFSGFTVSRSDFEAIGAGLDQDKNGNVSSQGFIRQQGFKKKWNKPATSTVLGTDSIRVRVEQDIPIFPNKVEEKCTRIFRWKGPGYKVCKDKIIVHPNNKEYMATPGDVSSRYTITRGTDNDEIHVKIAVPGQKGYCGGYSSPLMLFFEGDNIPRFTGRSSFPLNPSGLPVWWPESGSQGYFLSLDRNRDGKITTANELFGTQVWGEEDEVQNGFEVLRELDSNKDGVIDTRDDRFSELRLWQDSNGDGVSQGSELRTLKEKGVLFLSLRYESNRVRPIGGRAELREEGLFSYRNAQGQQKSGRLIDVWFMAAPNKSKGTKQP